MAAGNGLVVVGLVILLQHCLLVGLVQRRCLQRLLKRPSLLILVCIWLVIKLLLGHTRTRVLSRRVLLLELWLPEARLVHCVSSIV